MKKDREELDAVMAQLKASHPHLTEKQIRKSFLDMKKETENARKVRAEVTARMQALALAEIKRVVQSLQPEDIGIKFDDGGAYPFLNIRFGDGNRSWWGDFSIAETHEMQRCKKLKVPTPKSKLVCYTDGTARIEATKKGRNK
jgi:hypothetical protein